MSRKEKKLITISIIVSVLIVVVAYSYQIGSTTSSEEKEKPTPDVATTTDIQEDLTVGEPGSTHAHASFVMLINGDFYNFSRERYYEKSNYAHFHKGNGVIIHKHAKGVSLPYFLETLGVSFAGDCLVLDEGDEYCDSENNQWRMVVNGNIIEKPDKYEIRHGDRILLDYSNDSKAELRLKAQSTTPEVPKELMQDSSNIE